MKKKQLISKGMLAAALSASMVFSLAACSNSDSGSKGSEGSSEQVSAEVSAAGEESPEQESQEEEEPAYDFGGRVFKIGSYYDMTPNPEDSAVKAALAERIAYVEENYNCTIEFVTLDDYKNAYVTSVLAGDPVVDIGYAISNDVLPSWIEGGIVQSISALDVIDFDDYKWGSATTEAGYYKGENYLMGLEDPEIRYGIFWNKTLFDQYGLPDLYELMEKGEWTWDKFKEIAMAANQDTDNDGTIDIYGLNVRENLAWCYLFSNGINVASKTESGIKIDLSDPRVVEALTALQDFTTTVDYREIDWSVDSWNSLITSFRDGTSMMCLEELWISYAYLGEMSDEWGFVPFPMGNSATDYSCYGKETSGRVILNGVEDPESVALVYDLITDVADTEEEWDELMEDRLENLANDSQSKDNISYICDNNLLYINGVMGFSDLNTIINNMLNDVMSGSSTPQTAIETYQSQIDSAIADLENYDYEAALEEQYGNTEE